MNKNVLGVKKEEGGSGTPAACVVVWALSLDSKQLWAKCLSFVSVSSIKEMARVLTFEGTVTSEGPVSS